MNKQWTITVIVLYECLLIGFVCLFSDAEAKEPANLNRQVQNRMIQSTKLQVLYTETDDDVTTIWIAQFPDLKPKTVLARISHASGYPIKAALSPDGQKIAYTLLSPGAGDPSFNGSLWFMYLNQPPKKLDEQIDYYVLPKWTLDSTSIVSLKTIPISPHSPKYRTELYVIGIDGIKKNLLLSDDTALSINPIGWAKDSKLFYYARITPTGDDLWAVGFADSNPRFITPLSEGAAWNLTLNSNGKEILGSIIERRNLASYAVISLSTDGKNRHVWVSGANRHYTPIWGPDSASLTYNIPSSDGNQSELKTVNRSSGSKITTLARSNIGMYVPVSWSPDGKLLVCKLYHQSSIDLSVMDYEGTIYDLISSSNWLQFVGFISNQVGITLPQEVQPDSKEQQIREAVEQVLSSESVRGYKPIPSGTRLLSVKIDEEKTPLKIILNFNKELISQGTGIVLQDSVHQISVAITNENPWVKDVEYMILIEGVPIIEFYD